LASDSVPMYPGDEPFVILFSEHRTGQTDEGGTVGKDADQSVRRRRSWSLLLQQYSGDLDQSDGFDQPIREPEGRGLPIPSSTCPSFSERFGSFADPGLLRGVLQPLQPCQPPFGESLTTTGIGPLGHRHRGARSADRGVSCLRSHPRPGSAAASQSPQSPHHCLDQRAITCRGGRTEGVIGKCLRSVDRFRSPGSSPAPVIGPVHFVGLDNRASPFYEGFRCPAFSEQVWTLGPRSDPSVICPD